MQIQSQPNTDFDKYYSALSNFSSLNISHEQGIRSAFRSLLETYSKPTGWTLVEELIQAGNRKRPDATLLDSFKIPRGRWEAKDTNDDLEEEIKKKIKLGYDLKNIIFENTQKAVLFQDGNRIAGFDLKHRNELADLLERFFNYEPAHVEEFHKAVAVFQSQIPDLASGLIQIVDKAREDTPAFVQAFSGFHDLCRKTLNPQITAKAIEEMLVQHLLTERLFRNVFDSPEFISRNIIAVEIEKVISTLTRKHFSRQTFLKSLDYFYEVIEAEAKTISDFSEKQGFLNTIYEKFFQDFSKDTADTHGIVYTPQVIVDFMCASADYLLNAEFGKSLCDEGVAILDPCTGTGNFLVNILRRIGQSNPMSLEAKYESDLYANEVMLLPYYVASLNIEHAYYDLMGNYVPFPGVCFVDTLDLAEDVQTAMFTEENSDRVEREQQAPITVIIGNPPYNVGQKNENDNNKNRPYPIIDKKISDTYIKSSAASNKNAMGDAYIRFFRWASDRLGKEGIVCFVTNNGFLNGIGADGFRKHLAQDFTKIYHFDFKGNARTSGQRRRDEGGNIFNDQIRTGVGITFLVRSPENRRTGEPENRRTGFGITRSAMVGRRRKKQRTCTLSKTWESFLGSH